MAAHGYSDEFKHEAVVRVLERGQRITHVARKLGISRAALYNWIQLYDPDPSVPPPPAKPESELTRLKREVMELREENRFLKKAAAYFAKDRPRGTR